jgi:hypothetical protein
MASTVTLRIRAVVRLFQRVLLGAAIGIAFEVVYIAIDYIGESDKQLYFFDHKASIYTLLPLGGLIGAAIGVAWAVVSKVRNKV